MGMCHLLPKRMQCDVHQRSTNWANDFNQKMKMTCIEQTIHSFLFFCASFPFIFTIYVDLFVGKTYSTLDKWIVTSIHSVAILFQLPPCTICVNTQISKAVMATAFEYIQLIATNVMPATNIINPEISYFVETVGIYCKLVMRCSPI